LRGLDSFSDQNFVQDYAAANDNSVFITQFDTKALLRILTYKLLPRQATTGFNELPETEKYDYILTAHHADES
jgi:tRNA(Ile)-lysidine synthase